MRYTPRFNCVFDAEGVPFYHKISIDLTPAHLQLLAAEGLQLRTGPYSREEDQLIWSNWRVVAEEHDLPLHCAHEFVTNVRDLNADYASLAASHSFWPKICHGLERTLRSIKARCCRVFDQFIPGVINRRDAKFTKEEDEQLFKLVDRYGRKWSLVSENLGRSTTHCRDRFHDLINRKRFSGPFDNDQQEQIIDSVGVVTGCTRSMCLSLRAHVIDWNEVARYMKSNRRPFDLRRQWVTIRLQNRPKRYRKLIFTAKRNKYFLKLLQSLRFENEATIDWQQLVQMCSTNEYLSPQVVDPTMAKQLWAYLKRHYWYRINIFTTPIPDDFHDMLRQMRKRMRRCRRHYRQLHSKNNDHSIDMDDKKSSLLERDDL